MDENAPYMKEAAELQERLGAKSVFLIIFDPKDKRGQVVCGGNLTIESGISLLGILKVLQGKIADDLRSIVESKKQQSREHLNN